MIGLLTNEDSDSIFNTDHTADTEHLLTTNQDDGNEEHASVILVGQESLIDNGKTISFVPGEGHLPISVC